MAKQKKQEVKIIELKPINRKSFMLTIVGDNPLITHRWSEKAKKEMRDKHMGEAVVVREKKDPERDYRESLYWLDNDGNLIAEPPQSDPAKHKTGFGFPSVGIKAAAVSACRNLDGIPMTLARNVFHIPGEYIKIDGTPSMREDMVRLNGTKADIRYRGQFVKWSSTFKVVYNEDVMKADQIVNLFNLAGFAVGIGEWRPEKDGSYGTFSVK